MHAHANTAADHDLTALIRLASGGEADALDRLFRETEPHLRRLARSVSWSARRAARLRTTEIIDDGFMRLVQNAPERWADRDHFFRVAALVMHDIVVDETRRCLAQKRGGDRGREPLAEDAGAVDSRDLRSGIEITDLTTALRALREAHPETADVLLCRYAMGLDRARSAHTLGISVHAVDRHHGFARAWLRATLSSTTAAPRASGTATGRGSPRPAPGRIDDRRWQQEPQRGRTLAASPHLH